LDCRAVTNSSSDTANASYSANIAGCVAVRYRAARNISGDTAYRGARYANIAYRITVCYKDAINISRDTADNVCSDNIADNKAVCDRAVINKPRDTADAV
jgi:hypothetical protein